MSLKKISNKIRSQRGASIIFALLLFLVCAALGSAVLIAGTAAAGRAADTAKMDQHYYAVTSAAGLLKDSLSKQGPFTVVREKTTTTEITTVLTIDENGNVTGTEPGGSTTLSTDYSLALDGEYISDDLTFLEDISCRIAGGDKYTDVMPDSAWAWEPSLPAEFEPRTISFTPAGENNPLSPGLNVEAEVIVTDDGVMEFTVSSVVGADENDKDIYQVTFTLTPKFVTHETSSETVTGVSSTVGPENTVTETEDVVLTETKTTVIKWTVSDIKKVAR